MTPHPDKIEVTLTVSTQAQATELSAAWREIVTGQELERLRTLEQDTAGIIERAYFALQNIQAAINENLSTGQAERLVRFLAGVYSGSHYPFDLTDLRALDTKLANACLDYLNYDRLGKREVHHHLTGGAEWLHRCIKEYGIEHQRRDTR